jgi:hypothetical protein
MLPLIGLQFTYKKIPAYMASFTTSPRGVNRFFPNTKGASPVSAPFQLGIDWLNNICSVACLSSIGVWAFSWLLGEWVL